MNSLLFISQLLIPTLPANVTENNFIKESVATVSCVATVEDDSTVGILDVTAGKPTVTKKLIVAVKKNAKAEACAAAVVKEIDGLTVDAVMPSLGMFILSYEAPAPLAD